ncbi:hypothetical protein [Micromonospora sp. NPDC051141]|uniref:hypothetical protein n=1 Tax=Micromonospora sp. NPDC051141 TaxID=3364284 RepID=UPI00379431B4
MTTPLIVCQVQATGQEPAPLLIDGTHRLYCAWREHVPRLPAYLLTTAETREIQTPR